MCHQYRCALQAWGATANGACARGTTTALMHLWWRAAPWQAARVPGPPALLHTCTQPAAKVRSPELHSRKLSLGCPELQGAHGRLRRAADCEIPTPPSGSGTGRDCFRDSPEEEDCATLARLDIDSPGVKYDPCPDAVADRYHRAIMTMGRPPCCPCSNDHRTTALH